MTRSWRTCLSLCAVFFSSLPLFGQAGTDSLLSALQAEARQEKSLSGHITLSRRGPDGRTLTVTGDFSVAKPNLASIQLAGDDADPPRTAVSDGRDLFALTIDNHYTRVAVDSTGDAIREPWWALPVSFFFSQSLNPFGPKADPSARFKRLPDAALNGQTMHVLEEDGSQPMSYTAVFYADEQNRLVQSKVSFGPGPGAAFFTAEISRIRTDRPVTQTTYHFVPPAGAVLKGSPTDSMLPVGETAPVFHLPGLAPGKTISLTSVRARATLVNFWFLNCPPCRIEFPDFQKLYTELHGKGLEIVAIDRADTREQVEKYVLKTGLTFPVALGGEADSHSVFAQYRVTDTFPATYLLDASGRVVYRANGVDPEGLRKALAELGVR